MIREEEKKENSHLTVCGSDYGSKCAVWYLKIERYL